jgi:putative ATP-binding cassette transporter
MLIGRQLTQNNKRAEAELRAMGTHWCESGEDKALRPDGRDGLRAMEAALAAVGSAWLTFCWQLMRLTIITHTNSLLTPVIGVLLCTPKYVAGTMLLGEVVQAAAAFVVVQGACSWFTDNYTRLAEGLRRPIVLHRCFSRWTRSINVGRSMRRRVQAVDWRDPEGRHYSLE